MGLLTNVLFYLYLDDFDREIINLFPSINYARFLHAAIFAITQQSQSAASVLASVDKIENILRVVVDQADLWSEVVGTRGLIEDQKCSRRGLIEDQKWS